MIPIGAESETASDGGAGGLLDAEGRAAAAGRRAGGERRPELAERGEATPTPSTTPRDASEHALGEGLAGDLKPTPRCVQPSALSVRKHAHALTDRGEREQRSEQERSRRRRR